MFDQFFLKLFLLLLSIQSRSTFSLWIAVQERPSTTLTDGLSVKIMVGVVSVISHT